MSQIDLDGVSIAYQLIGDGEKAITSRREDAFQMIRQAFASSRRNSPRAAIRL